MAKCGDRKRITQRRKGAKRGRSAVEAVHHAGDAVLDQWCAEVDEQAEKLDPLDYPKAYTDPEWKKLEKRIKVKATGVGKLLRELERAVGKVNLELAGGADKAKLKTLRKAAVAAAKKAEDKVKEQVRKAEPRSDAFDALWSLQRNLDDYGDLLERWDVDDHRGLAWAIDRFNDRTKPRH